MSVVVVLRLVLMSCVVVFFYFFFWGGGYCRSVSAWKKIFSFWMVQTTRVFFVVFVNPDS